MVTDTPLASDVIDAANTLSHSIIGAAIEVHRALGPGLRESHYRRAMCIELGLREVPFESKVPIAILYKGEPIQTVHADLIVGNLVMVNLVSVDAFDHVRLAEMLARLRTTRMRLGLLINFHESTLVRGLRRVIN